MAATVVRTVCPKDCPDTCGLLAHVEDGRVTRVVGDPDHPVTRGFLCGRFQHYEELIHHPDRLLRPLVRERKSEPFREASLDEALTLVADRLGAIAREHGGGAILPYSYLANMGVLANRAADPLWNRLGTSRVGMEICAMAGAEALFRVLGRVRGTEPQFLDRTKLYVAWGRNPKATGVHSWALTRDIRPRVVIDPFRSDTAKAADLWIQPRPGTDSLLVIGMLRLLIERGWVDTRFVEERTTGYEALAAKVLSVSLADVVAGTGVPLARIEELTELYHSVRPGLLHAGVGLQRNTNGGEMVAAICMLAALTGQVGLPGGGVLYANFDWNWADISHAELRGGDAPRMVSMLQLGRALTADDSLQALVVYNANPASTAPNQSLVWQGLGREDLFTVVHDMWLTDTARFANVVLPATSFAEAPDVYRSYWHDYAQAGNVVIPPVGESISNFRLFQELGQRLGFDDACFRASEEEVLRAALVGTGLELDDLRAGPMPAEDPAHTSFEDGRFPTPSGRLELLVPTFTPAADAGHRYRFITPKSREQHGSQLFTYERKQPMLATPFLFLDPADAAAEGIADGDPVRCWNERGSAEFVAKISDRVQPGLVASYMVRWGSNANATTSDEPADMGGNSTFHTNYVSLSLSTATLPA